MREEISYRSNFFLNKNAPPRAERPSAESEVILVAQVHSPLAVTLLLLMYCIQFFFCILQLK